MSTRAAAHPDGRQRQATESKLRAAVFGVIVVGVLALGALLAFGDFFNRPAAAGGAIDVQSSMAGFTPSEIRVTAGSTATFDWWTQDASMHLEGGVHTMIAPELGLYETLSAESRRLVTWQVPDKPGTYDVYCDTCCGGKDSPTMHGRIVIDPAA
ncbi:MAG: cupredoxin domain-containing protein [Candidatus Limnocylindrales bacterium]